MHSEDSSTRLVIAFDGREPGGLDLEGLWMRNRLLERIFGEVEPMPRFGDRWRLREGVDAARGLPVEDDQGIRGVLHFLVKPPTLLQSARLLGFIEDYVDIEHPHLERVIDFGEIDDRPWIVRTTTPTRLMREWLHESVETWSQLIEKFLGPCRALARLHQQGLVHGELIPDAFALDDEGRTILRGTLDAAAQRMTNRRPDKASVAADQADLCMAIHGALLAVETALACEPPAWLIEALERGFADHPRDQWPSVDALADHLEHRLRMRARLSVLQGGAAA